MLRRVVAVATAVLVVSGCSSADNPSAARRTTTTTIAATATTPPLSGERQLCGALAASDLSNPEELIKIPLSRTTDSAFDVPSAFLAARLTALKAAIQTGADLAFPARDAANAATDVMEVCRQRGYL